VPIGSVIYNDRMGKAKVNITLEQAMKVQRGIRRITLFFFNLGAIWVGWSTPDPGCLTPGKDMRYPFCRRLVGSQGRSGQVRKISPQSNSISGSSSS